MPKRLVTKQVEEDRVWDVGRIVLTALITALLAWIGYITVLALSVESIALRVEKKLDSQVTVLHARITKVDDEAEKRDQELMMELLRRGTPP